MNRLMLFIWIVLVGTVTMSRAFAAEYVLHSEEQAMVGEVKTVIARWEDTLLEIGRRHGVGYEEIVRANPGVDPWLPGEGTEVLVPLRFVLPDVPRRGIVINLPEYRMYYFPEPAAGEAQRVITYPVSIGRMDWETPVGVHRIIEKRRNPTWYPPESVREDRAASGRPVPAVVPPGPDNPLGSRALRLSLPSYLIHGTNQPRGMGMRVTAGCIRLHQEDVEALYDKVDVGTEVRIINEPLKVGWADETLFIEAHPPLEEYAEEFAARRLTVLTKQVVRATESQSAVVDWSSAEAVVFAGRGVPMAMATRVPAAEPAELEEGEYREARR